MVLSCANLQYPMDSVYSIGGNLNGKKRKKETVREFSYLFFWSKNETKI